MARGKKKTTEINTTAEVRVTRDYHDILLNRLVKSNEVLEVTPYRMKLLIDAKVAKLICLKN